MTGTDERAEKAQDRTQGRTEADAGREGRELPDAADQGAEGRRLPLWLRLLLPGLEERGPLDLW